MLHKCYNYLFLFFTILLLLGLACSSPNDPDPKKETPPEIFSYSFDEPDKITSLPKELNEISGLSQLDDRYLGAIQDEKGDFFMIDMKTGEIIVKNFGKNGDYEAVTRVGLNIYVLRSNGTLFKIKDWQASVYDVEKIETPLKAANNAEGLVYDEANNRLLIACKDDPINGEQFVKSIYAYDLTNNLFLNDPVYSIHIDQSQYDLSNFKPSDLAFHPITGELFVLSATQKSLIVLKVDGTIASFQTLQDSLYEQPEGIMFLGNGDMFISNEKGAADSATLVRLNNKL